MPIGDSQNEKMKEVMDSKEKKSYTFSPETNSNKKGKEKSKKRDIKSAPNNTAYSMDKDLVNLYQNQTNKGKIPSRKSKTKQRKNSGAKLNSDPSSFFFSSGSNSSVVSNSESSLEPIVELLEKERRQWSNERGRLIQCIHLQQLELNQRSIAGHEKASQIAMVH